MNLGGYVAAGMFLVTIATMFVSVGRMIARLEGLQKSFDAFVEKIENETKKTHDQVVMLTARCPNCYERTPTPVRVIP